MATTSGSWLDSFNSNLQAPSDFVKGHWMRVKLQQNLEIEESTSNKMSTEGYHVTGTSKKVITESDNSRGIMPLLLEHLHQVLQFHGVR